jgi:hypothetical protein
MAPDASAAVGAPEIAGTLVNPKGYAKKAIARTAGREVAGLVGSTAAALAARAKSVSDLPDFGRVGYLAVSAGEIVLVKTRYGWKMTPTDEALARAPRSALAAVDWDEGKLISHLTLSFNDGQAWAFDVPKSDKKTARAVVEALRSATIEQLVGGIDGS